MSSDYDYDRDREDPPAPPRCRRCGAKDLVWERENDGRWRLYTLGGKVHECPRRDAAEDFKRFIRKETK